MTKVAFVFISAFIIAAYSASASDWNLGQGGNLDVYDFSSCGFDENNNPSWQLKGQKATVRGTVTRINNCELVFFLKNKTKKKDSAILTPDESGKLKVILKTPQCDFSHAMGEVKSDQPLAIDLGTSIDATGIGFDIDLKRHVVLIRSAVKLTFILPEKTAKALKKGHGK